MVINFDGSTFPLNGNNFLNPVLFLPLLPLNGAGIGGISPVVNGAPAGTVFSLQMWFIDPTATTTASLEGTNVRVITVLL